MRRVMTVAAFVLLGLSAGCGASDMESAPAVVTSDTESVPVVVASDTEIAPAVYVAGECAGRLVDEIDGAPTLALDTSRLALAVCARQGSDEWVMVDGELGVENITGAARVVPFPPENASSLADAPASLEPITGRGVTHPAREQKKGSGIYRDMPGYSGMRSPVSRCPTGGRK